MHRRMLACVAIAGLTLGLVGCSPEALRLHALKMGASGEVIMVVRLCPGMRVLIVSAYENSNSTSYKKWHANPAADFPTQFEVALLGTPQQWNVEDSSDLATVEENVEYASDVGADSNAPTGSLAFTLADLRHLPAGEVLAFDSKRNRARAMTESAFTAQANKQCDEWEKRARGHGSGADR